jgi:hypothetical protein
MALINTIENEMFLITVENAYHKVNNVNINVLNNVINVEMLIYGSKKARFSNARPIEVKNIPISFQLVEMNEGSTFIAKVYNVIKSNVLDYKNSTDDLVSNAPVGSVNQPLISGQTENNI